MTHAKPTSRCAYVALGTNLGDRRGNLNRAIVMLHKMPKTKVIGVADAVETKPVGCPPGSKDFLNSAMVLSTTLDVHEFFKQLQSIENRLGRTRSEPNAARTIDLDLLMFDDVVMNQEQLILPHPRMLEREFVLRPLAQIAPDVVHPVAKVTMFEALGALLASGVDSRGAKKGSTGVR